MGHIRVGKHGIIYNDYPASAEWLKESVRSKNELIEYAKSVGSKTFDLPVPHLEVISYERIGQTERDCPLKRATAWHAIRKAVSRLWGKDD